MSTPKKAQDAAEKGKEIVKAVTARIPSPEREKQKVSARVVKGKLARITITRYNEDSA